MVVGGAIEGLRTVLKFGGSCLKSRADISAIADRIRMFSPFPVVVVSAFFGVTDRLLDAVNDIRSHSFDRSSFLRWIRDHHYALAPEILTSDSLPRFEEALVNLDLALASLVNGEEDEISVLVSGERLSSVCLEAALSSRGIKVRAMWAEDVPIRVKGRTPFVRMDLSRTSESAYIPTDEIPLIAGWYGIDQSENLATMSRGGSDCTATYIAAIIGAAAVIIWRDVPGVLSLDPSWGMRGRRIPYLNYREAVEIASYSSRLLHPDAIEPLVESGIPMIIRPLHQPDEPGTYVGPSISIGQPTVRVLVCHRRRFDLLWRLRSGGSLSSSLTGLGRLLHKQRIKIWSIRADPAGIRVLLDEADLTRVESSILGFDSEAEIQIGPPLALLSVFGEGISSNHNVRETLLDSLLGLGIDAWELESQEEGHAIHLLFNDEDAVTAVGRLTECFELLDAD